MKHNFFLNAELLFLNLDEPSKSFNKKFEVSLEWRITKYQTYTKCLRGNLDRIVLVWTVVSTSIRIKKSFWRKKNLRGEQTFSPSLDAFFNIASAVENKKIKKLFLKIFFGSLSCFFLILCLRSFTSMHCSCSTEMYLKLS